MIKPLLLQLFSGSMQKWNKWCVTLYWACMLFRPIFRKPLLQGCVREGMSGVYTLKRSSKWPLFNFIFSDLALMILKWFFANRRAFQWTKVKWCFGRVFYHFRKFWAQKCKNQIFWRKWGFKVPFLEMQWRWFQTRLTPNPWIFCLWTIFYDFF